MAPKVEAYILHCESPNGDELLQETLATLSVSSYDPLEIKTIENGCDVPWLLPEQKIHLSANLGVSRGYNVALHDFMGARRGRYCLLLNNDIAVGKEMVSRLVETAEADPRIGIVAPRIYYYGTKKIWYDGGIFNPWTGVTRHKNIRKIGPAGEVPKVTDYATGCCMLISRDCIERVGDFDVSLSPAYGEDVDYSLRARSQKFLIVVNPKAIMWHKVSQSIETIH